MEEIILIERKQIPIMLFIFITVFEPPLLPAQLIYIQGIIELVYLFIFKILKSKTVDLTVLNHSGMSNYYLFLMMLWVLLSLSRMVDIIFFNGQLSFLNWSKSTNQILLLSFIEFINLDIIFNYFENHKYSLNDIFESIVNVGAIQGILSLTAYEIPTVRMLFLKFAGDMYNNSWILERRGYGFSQSLLDGFGYGMGLIAGVLIIRLRFNTKRNFMQILKLILISFSILVNSRTGLIILLTSILLKVTVSDNMKNTLIKLPLAIIILYIFMYSLVPIINWGIGSVNTNINWIASDIGGLIKAILPSVNINTTLAQAQSTSNPYFNSITNIQFPSNPFQFLFGKGWLIYLGSQTGYRSDNGYVNMFWMFGIVGTIAYYLYNLYITSKIFHKVDGAYKLILIFNYIALLIYSVKGRPIGYSSGILLFYFIIFSLNYFSESSSMEGE